VAADRGTIGATVNQLTASQSVEGAAVTNLTSAVDSIQNADVGQVVAQMTQNSVLEQTGMAALSQSNSIQQNVLKLLQ
jgi:flagellin